jgi:hypothetical protein
MINISFQRRTLICVCARARARLCIYIQQINARELGNLNISNEVLYMIISLLPARYSIFEWYFYCSSIFSGIIFNRIMFCISLLI